MGAEQLVQRMICAEGNIDAQRLRNGQLQADDWRKLTMAMALSNAGFISMILQGFVSLRFALSERLKQEHGLRMIMN